MTVNTQQAFAIKICLGLGVGAWFMLWTAYQHPEAKLKAWLDVYLGTCLGGIIGARLVYVLFHLERFIASPLDIPRLWYGELAWQGAFLGAGMAVYGLCRWRKVPISPFSDGLALVMPMMLITVCWASRSAGLILGETVADLKSHPVWMAGFLPALDRDVQPRYELQMLGIGLGAGILFLIGALTLWDKGAGWRIWLALALTGLAIFVLDHFSAGAGHEVYGVQADQVGAGIVWLIGLGFWVLSVSWKLKPLSDWAEP